MSFVSYQTINSLEDISFIGGTNYTITFDIFDDAGLPIDSVLYGLTWKLFYYGQPDYTVLLKSGVYAGSPNNRFTVTLNSADTEQLFGKFMHQAIITDTNNEKFIPAQGTILIVSGAQ